MPRCEVIRAIELETLSIKLWVLESEDQAAEGIADDIEHCVVALTNPTSDSPADVAHRIFDLFSAVSSITVIADIGDGIRITREEW